MDMQHELTLQCTRCGTVHSNLERQGNNKLKNKYLLKL